MDPGENSGHTPTPWMSVGVATKGNGDEVDAVEVSAGWRTVAILDNPDDDPEIIANGAFIVRAVNAHDDLLNAAVEAATYGADLQPDLRAALVAAIAKARS